MTAEQWAELQSQIAAYHELAAYHAPEWVRLLLTDRYFDILNLIGQINETETAEAWDRAHAAQLPLEWWM